MAHAKVGDKGVSSIWNRMTEKAQRLKRLGEIKYRVGQYVRISKQKLKFAKGGEQNYTTEICKIRKVIRRTPRPVYELEDLRGNRIDVQFYTEELTPIRITERTTYKIDKILRKRVRRGIPEYLVRWRGYGPEFDSWVTTSEIKSI
jgi:hypothetical protein